MGYVVRMPQLGMTMEEGVVVEWTVGVDEPFEDGTVVAVVESEKTINEIEARQDGVLVERFVELDHPVGPGDPIAYIGEEGETVPEDLEASTDEPSAVERDEEAASGDTAAAASSEGKTTTLAVAGQRVSPRARSYVTENDLDIDLDGIEGTGPDGAVVEADVVAAAEALTETGEAATADAAAVAEGRGIYEERTGGQLRKTIARRMTTSAQEAPQVTLNRRVSVDDLLDTKAQLEADLNLDVSISDFVVAALAEALDEYPEFNGVYEDGTHKLARNVNVGVAVAVEGGLVTPVIRGSQALSLAEINAERTRLVGRVKRGEHTGDDFAHGTITVSNLGHFDVDSFDPILNPPEVALLGVGSLRPELDPETREQIRTLGLSLTFDHRAVDGADGARFLDAVVDALVHPLRLVGFGRGEQADTERDSPFHEGDDVDEERTAHAAHESGMRASIRTRRFGWAADEPADLGGEDSAPNPVEQFLGSLAACLALTVQTVADRRDIRLDDVAVDVHAEPLEGRIESIDTTVTLVSDEDDQKLKRIVQTAERACYVNSVVSEGIERSLSIDIESA